MTRVPTPLRRLAAPLVLAVLAAGVGVVPAPASAQAPPPLLAGLAIEGRGYGHGIGLSQYGAYGWAVEQGWDWTRILDHYYGGTQLADLTDADFGNGTPGRMTLRLVALDDAQTSVVSDTGQARLAGDPVPDRPWGSLVAREIAPNLYRVYGRPDAVCAPPAAVNLDDPAQGWAVVADLPGPVDFSTPQSFDPAAAVPGGLLGVCEPAGNVRYYRGVIRAANGTQGENRTVNDVLLESYLKGVVPRESPASWGDSAGGAGMNALRAQAVAARSYALADGFPNGRYSYAKACDTQACQVYGGAAVRFGGMGAGVSILEDARTNRAVDETAGKIRRWLPGNPSGRPVGQVVLTMFSSSNGGRTAPNFDGTILFPIVADPADATASNPNHVWVEDVSAATVQAKYPQVGQPRTVTVTKRDGAGGPWGGYAQEVTISGTAGTVKVTGWAFRTALGLKNFWFETRNVPVQASAIPVGRVLLIGNSVGASAADELDLLFRPGYPDLQTDLVSGRCTVGSCVGADALTVLRSSPTPQVLVMETGYNDTPSTLGGDIDQIMAEATARGVVRVVWSNLSERRWTSAGNPAPFYGASNVALAAAAAKWPQLTVLDWNAYSSGDDKTRWFNTNRLSDGRQDLVHLTTSGQAAFALFLREQLDALRAAGVLSPAGTTAQPAPPPPPPPAVDLPVGPFRRGSRGEPVKAVQSFLTTYGYRPGPIDGIYGSMTAGAVSRFQTEARGRGWYPYSIDGVWGPKTQAAATQKQAAG